MVTAKDEFDECAEVYTALREQALSAGQLVHEADPEELAAFLMEFRNGDTVVTLAAFRDGTTSLYFSHGGGILGGGDHEAVRRAVTDLLGFAQRYIPDALPMESFPLPKKGEVRFYLATPSEVRGDSAAETDLVEERHRFSQVFHAGHYLISKILEQTEAAEQATPSVVDPLERRVVAPVRSCVGAVLRSVTYRCIPGETDASGIERAEVCIGGELVLGFEQGLLCVSWDENAGFDSHFSVRTGDLPLFHLDDLETFDGSASGLWRAHIGQPLISAKVLGWDEVPYTVCLSFPEGTVAVSSAAGRAVGDGDDLLVQDARNLKTEVPPVVLWSSRN